MSDQTVTEFAPAKLNLYLHVTGRRDDGYHLLDSLVAFADVGDRLSAAPSADLRLSVDGPFAAQVPCDDDNLVLRAARALAAALDRPPVADLRLTKILPVASGIGGGSADAAATLRVLLTLWDVELPAPALDDLALRLGADVPVCLHGRTCYLSGVGERLDPAPSVAGQPIVLVNPGVGVSTPAVFKARRGPFSSPQPLSDPQSGPRGLAPALAQRRNDLAPPAMALVPSVADVLAALEAAPACLLARMSGSGATCFGLFETDGGAQEAARVIAARHPSWWVQPARLQ